MTRVVRLGALAWLMVWLGLSAQACQSFEVSADLCTLDEHCDSGEVCTVAGRCFECEDTLCPPHIRCDEDDDCSGLRDTCGPDKVCRQGCDVDLQCPLTDCDTGDDVCTESFGFPCSNRSDFDTDLDPTSCFGECVEKDSRDDDVPGYCTGSCDGGVVCPSGYECVYSECRLITGEPRCVELNPQGFCGSCLISECQSRLSDCCAGDLCQDILTQVNQCDLVRGSACDALFDGFQPGSSVLRACLVDHCEQSCGP